MNISSILVIIQRSNGDVLLSTTLIDQLQKQLKPHAIDLLVNDDTLAIAKTLPYIRQIHTFSYQQKQTSRWSQEKSIIKKIYKKYDLSINLTASDRSVLYALLASKQAISAIEKNKGKSWWKRLLLKHHYQFDSKKHILLNNLEPLSCLDLSPYNKQIAPRINEDSVNSISNRLKKLNISKFIIFHPSAQYNYKIYSETLRNELLRLLNKLDVAIIVTGSNNKIDTLIKNNLPILNNIVNWIGQTSIEEYIALSEISQGYIGMDTLNMHIAASQNKRIFAIFGPTILAMWSPWSNQVQTAATIDMPVQTYGNITIFQANMACVACGKAGCDNKHGKSECLYKIKPRVVFEEVEKWYKSL